MNATQIGLESGLYAYPSNHRFRRREAEGGTVRYRLNRATVRGEWWDANHLRVRPHRDWYAAEEDRALSLSLGLSPAPNPYPEPEPYWRDKITAAQRDEAERIAANVERRRLAPGEPKSHRAQLWPRFGAKELERAAIAEARQ